MGIFYLRYIYFFTNVQFIFPAFHFPRHHLYFKNSPLCLNKNSHLNYPHSTQHDLSLLHLSHSLWLFPQQHLFRDDGQVTPSPLHPPAHYHRQDPGCGVLLTLCQFIFIASIGFLSHIRFSKSSPYLFHQAPLTEYLKHTSLFFLISVLNNKAFDFGVSQPFHTVFRSGSLLVSFLVGSLLFSRK